MVTPQNGTDRVIGSNGRVASGLTGLGWDTPGPSDRSWPPTVGQTAWPPTRTPGALQGFGLSAREARVYLTLITRGPLGARRATEYSGLHRATAYRVLSQLLNRGLVRVERRWPREYHPVPLRVLVERNVAFLRDEIELRHWLLRAFPPAPEPGAAGRTPSRVDHARGTGFGDSERATELPMGVTSIGSVAESPLFERLQAARRGVDALIRPLTIPAGLRSKIAGSLGRTAARGQPVRVVLDYLAADSRFAALLRRARSPPAAGLEIRHYTPLGGHCYIVDGKTALRFPVPSGGWKDLDFGFVSENVDFVRTQQARFEAIWDDAVPRRGTRISSEIAHTSGASLTDRFPRTARPGAGDIQPVPAGGPAGRVGSR
jgi:hypothetical protein